MNPAMTGAAAGSDGSAQVGTTPGPRPGQPALPVLGAYGPAPVPSGAAPGTISDTVREMLGVLTRLQSDPASTILRSVLPQPDGRLTAALLLFFQAVKGGDARSWLGERGAETLERAGRTDLLGRLSAELAQGAVRASDAAGNDWRLFTIPLFNEGAVEPIRVILRDKHAKQQSGEERGRDEPESRFLVDFTLTRTGPMQIDGSLRPNRFDTVLRSYHVLPRAIRTGAQACFVEACAASGLAGTMTFQTGAHTWIKVATQARAATTQA